MKDEEKRTALTGLYQAEIGRMVMEYVGRIHPTVLENAMESRAIRTLEAIRQVLEDDRYDDSECYERVDALVMLFYRELGIRIDRHEEQE